VSLNSALYDGKPLSQALSIIFMIAYSTERHSLPDFANPSVNESSARPICALILAPGTLSQILGQQSFNLISLAMQGEDVFAA